MTLPIGLQLYTVRENLAQNFTRTVKKVAEIGYSGVETAGFSGLTPKEVADLFDSLGLEIIAAHTQMPVGEKKNEVLDSVEELGTRRIISSLSPDSCKTVEAIRSSCDLLNEATGAAAEREIVFGLHNHWWEFGSVEDQLVFDLLLDRLSLEMFFEIDTYWVRTAGVDPVEIIKKLGARAPLLHLKDGPGVQEKPMTALGEGIMDFETILQAGKDTTEWFIVELDRCATDMMEAVEKSYQYISKRGL